MSHELEDILREEQRPLVPYNEETEELEYVDNKDRYDIHINMAGNLDPESVDFEPLVTSLNGAAMTMPLPESKYSLDDNEEIVNSNSNDRNNGFRHRFVGGKDMQEVEESLDLELTEENDVRSCENKIRSAPSKLRAITLLMLPQRVSLFLADRDPSIMSSIVICLSFFIVIVLAATFSNTYRAFNGNLDSFSPPSNNSMLSRLASIRAEISLSGINPSDTVSMQGIALAPPVGTRLPPALDVFANVDDLPIELMDTAVFWHIPRSAGTTMKHVLATCLGRVITTEMGGTAGHNLDERLDVIKQPHGMFLNVDTTTKNGLKHANDLGLAQSKMADVVFTPYVQEAAILFQKKHRGRFFTIVRNPVDRLVSLYYYKRLATWEPNYNPLIAEQTLEDFVVTSGENWMVRTLTGCMTGPLQIKHLNAAKEIFRTKFLIGLLEAKTESLRRFEEFFGWKFPSPVSQTCKNNMFYFEWHSKNPHPPLDPANPIMNKIRSMNMWDVELYEYAKQLFNEQEVLFWNSDLEDVALESFVGNSQPETKIAPERLITPVNN